MLTRFSNPPQQHVVISEAQQPTPAWCPLKDLNPRPQIKSLVLKPTQLNGHNAVSSVSLLSHIAAKRPSTFIIALVPRAGIEPTSWDFQSPTHPSMSPWHMAEETGLEPARRSARVLVVFQTTALPIRLTPPILKHIVPMFQKKLHTQYIYYLC